MRNKFPIAALLLPLTICNAQAHVTLVAPSAKAGSEFVASFRVGHGCNGSPTSSLTVAIPPEAVSARAQAKAGWTIAQQTEPGASRVTSITWRGGSLSADQFDDFNILLRLPGKPGRLAFPVTQVCGTGVEHWADTPASGQKSTHPAPVLTVMPDAAPGGEMPGMAMP